jgi:hypothetical protein
LIGQLTSRLATAQFGHLNRTPVYPMLSIVNQDSFVSSVLTHASESELVVIPWSVPSNGGPLEEAAGSSTEAISTASSGSNPFDALFGSGIASSSPLYSHFLRQVFAECTRDVALFVHRGVNYPDVSETQGQHLLVVFEGGADGQSLLGSNINLICLLTSLVPFFPSQTASRSPSPLRCAAPLE